MSRKNDRTLRFYNEVLGLERLHYGIWLDNDELTIDCLKDAQIRYEDFLVKNIPKDVKNILDVGCGTGILINKLLSSGYQAEGLSPDTNQKINFTKNINAKFHHTKFENFNVSDQFDCLIMSESSQYINLKKLFEKADQALKKNGFLMICDYFALKSAKGVHGRSGHKYDKFLDEIANSSFEIIKQKDITESVTKTLDIGKNFAGRIQKAVEIGTEKIVNKHPHITDFLLWVFRNKIRKFEKQMQLLDSHQFKKNKTYQFILLQVNS